MANTKSNRVYGVKDIAKIFAVSTNAASDFLEEARIKQTFPVARFGMRYVVPADAFDKWNIFTNSKNAVENADVVLQGAGGNDFVYTPAEIQKILAISKTKTYEFLAQVYAEKRPFLVIRLGKNYRISKASFDQWFYQ